MSPAHLPVVTVSVPSDNARLETKMKINKAKRAEKAGHGPMRKWLGRHILGIIGLLLIIGCSIVLPVVLYLTHRL